METKYVIGIWMGIVSISRLGRDILAADNAVVMAVMVQTFASGRAKKSLVLWITWGVFFRFATLFIDIFFS